MEYLSLAELLGCIADAIVELPSRPAGAIDKMKFNNPQARDAVNNFLETNNPRIEWARKISISAKWLNEALHNSAHIKPHWMVFDDEKRFPVRNSAIEIEAITILTHTTGWGCRLEDNCNTTLRNAFSLNKFDTLPVEQITDRENEGIWPEGTGYLAYKISFIKEELLAFLIHNDIPYRLPVSSMIEDKISITVETATHTERGRMVAWKRTLIDNWGTMLSDHKGKKPDAKGVLAWFKANDPDGTIKPSGPEESFTWLKADTGTATTALKTFRNAIAELKKSGDIPN